MGWRAPYYITSAETARVPGYLPTRLWYDMHTIVRKDKTKISELHPNELSAQELMRCGALKAACLFRDRSVCVGYMYVVVPP